VVDIAKEGELQFLPRSLDTLKSHYQSSLPTPTIYTKKVPVKQEKQPSGIINLSTAKVYHLDPINIINMILNSPQIRQKMHIGMAELVDKPSELWHGYSWAESIRGCSGEYGL
jgi:hypothetical protein